MKRWIICSIWIVLLTGPAAAQQGETKKKTTAKPQQSSGGQREGTAVRKESATEHAAKGGGAVINLEAAAPPVAPGTLRIADPVVLTLKERAADPAGARRADARPLGAPKGAFGIADGRITLMPAGARTLGGITGSGTVGTGTSTGVLDMRGPATGLNGKNPYAGTSVYGTAVTGIGLNIQPADSLRTVSPRKN
ncbi:MAG TPA: hypothetical protein VHK69_01290 [Chitinophagaceae bacterium]|jgi:hypothetical protein|nr:hypothetical protein [Chitinophagaceae bacterium]